MKISLGQYLGVSLQTEILVLTLCGMLTAFGDESPTEFNSNLKEIWHTSFPALKFTSFEQKIIKSLISGVVLVRSFTLHLYLVFYMAILWPALYEENSALLIPWLVISGIKNLLMGLLSCFLGIYICLVCGDFRLACLEFLMLQIVRIGSSTYMWLTVFKYYRILNMSTHLPQQVPRQQCGKETVLRQRRVRSMMNDSSIKQEKLMTESVPMTTTPFYEYIPEISIPINHVSPGVSKSLETLMTAVISVVNLSLNQESDNISTPENFTLMNKAKILLGLTDTEINLAKERKEKREALQAQMCTMDKRRDLCVQIAVHPLQNLEQSEHEMKNILMDSTDSKVRSGCNKYNFVNFNCCNCGGVTQNTNFEILEPKITCDAACQVSTASRTFLDKFDSKTFRDKTVLSVYKLRQPPASRIYHSPTFVKSKLKASRSLQLPKRC